ncbi:uncharacterized protein SCHCODRAFT_02699522 [Schizophyllum commune H4-8]|uniref:Expressed protein n=1 Tax=Schizophyllum commune (strain H4-8 / FGSC 9210) TaxID=578458 RepID=D8Q209_SCHCM|nr:uncharacterized protein SCHCODRAFT_02699522 [Schizophyllum commune H4-8]KAI5895664.1 hypothetical protein SCHCODRAFT_02699522 [Schizophyllum commune H4-8]
MVAINARSSALAVSLVLATLASVDALPVQKDLSSSPQKQSSRSANAMKKVSSRSRFLRREPMVITEELHGPVHQQASFSIPKREEGLAARDHDHNHDYAHEHDHEHDRHHYEHDHDHDRDHDHHHRRSIAIANDYGSSYVLSRSAGKREQQGVPGFINIMSDQKKLGSLILDTSNSSHYVLDASEKNSTEMYLVSAGEGSGPGQYLVQVPLIDMQTASVVPYCATYDPNPPQAEPLTVEKCYDSTQAQTHKSQYFAFDKETGVIHPMWYSDKDSTDDNTAAAKAVDGSDAPEGSDIASVTDEGDLMSRDDSSQNMTAQSVTLVFAPAGTQVENVDDVTSSSISSVPTSTASTATVSRTATSSAASLTAADTPSSSSSATFATSTAISRSTSATSSEPSPTAAALDVEVVPNRASSSAVTSSVVTSSVAASSAHSLDAEAVASSIAASSSAASSSAASSTTVSSTDASLSAAAASASTAASSSMTPVTSATAPYQWMFKENTRL